MSFAKKHMYKQGWAEGKGLGRHETGMKTAIKVKIKRDQAGVGHDMGEEFTFQWWDHVFNRAASNITIKGEDDAEGSDSMTDDNLADFDISNKKPKKKYDPKAILYGRFVSGGVLKDDNVKKINELAEHDAIGTEASPLNNGINNNDGSNAFANGSVRASSSSDSDSDDSEEEMKLIAAAGLPEDELFRRCGGRTAHKGARHGLKASAKLERIERMENMERQLGLERNQEVVIARGEETPSIPNVSEKKKKKKRCADPSSMDLPEDPPPKKKKKDGKTELSIPKLSRENIETQAGDQERVKKKKRKMKKKKTVETNDDDDDGGVANEMTTDLIAGHVHAAAPETTESSTEVIKVKKRKKKSKKERVDESISGQEENLKPNIEDVTDVGVKKTKKKKKKN